MVTKLANSVLSWTQANKLRRWIGNGLFVLCAVILALSVWLSFTNRNKAITEAHQSASLIAIAQCRQTQVLIALSITKRPKSEVEETLRKAAIYVAPVNEALKVLGHPPCALPKG